MNMKVLSSHRTTSINLRQTSIENLKDASATIITCEKVVDLEWLGNLIFFNFYNLSVHAANNLNQFRRDILKSRVLERMKQQLKSKLSITRQLFEDVLLIKV